MRASKRSPCRPNGGFDLLHLAQIYAYVDESCPPAYTNTGTPCLPLDSHGQGKIRPQRTGSGRRDALCASSVRPATRLPNLHQPIAPVPVRPQDTASASSLLLRSRPLRRSHPPGRAPRVWPSSSSLCSAYQVRHPQAWHARLPGAEATGLGRAVPGPSPQSRSRRKCRPMVSNRCRASSLILPLVISTRQYDFALPRPMRPRNCCICECRRNKPGSKTLSR